MIVSAVIVVITAGQVTGQDRQPAERAEVEHGIDVVERQGPFPKPDAGYVTDLADCLSDNDEKQIEEKLWQVEEQSGIEIAVVTIDSMADFPGTPNATIEAFARGLFNEYGIGNLPDDKGVLLLVSKQDRKARIQLGNGWGNTRDGHAAKIMDGVIVPSFRDGRYADGISEGVDAIALTFARVRFGINWPLIGILAAIPIVGLIAFSLFKSGKRGWGWVCVGLLVVLVLAAVRMLYELIRSRGRMYHDDGGLGDVGGFGGGFGGGSSDSGGGATGSW